MPDDRLMRARAIILFLFVWLLVGFSLGTLTLLGPVRAIVKRLRAHDISSAVESGTVGIVILVFVVLSAGIAWSITTFLRGPRSGVLRGAVVAGLLLCAVVANLFWTHPALMRSSMGAEDELAQFTFGPYPDEAKLKELKKRGFTAVVSLLHPAVVPFEPQLIAAEKKSAVVAGIDVIHLPMLPWVSDNSVSIAKLEQLVPQKQNRYYVHCYLGLDRVLIVKRLIEQRGGTAALTSSTKGRKLSDGDDFERGEVVGLDASTFVIPYPTHDEFVRYVLGGQVDHVFAILDPNDKEDRQRLDEERKMLSRYEMKFEVLPLSSEKYDAAAVLAGTTRVRATQGRKVIHQFFGATSGKAALAAAFVEAWRGGQPPLLPSLKAARLGDGEVKFMNAAVATGPRPRAREFGAVLARGGVKQFVCVGAGSAFCNGDRAHCQKYGYGFTEVSENAQQLRAVVSRPGPHYVYGSSPDDVEDLVDDALDE
jgi:protein tyrosine phosphatase (PTP) superfamily phosphohydrolase (DUF442 family)